MGLVVFAQSQADLSARVGSSSTTSSGGPSRGGPKTISQNALRFINDTSYFPQTETSLAVDPVNTNHVLGGFNDQKFFFCRVLPSDCASSGVPASSSGFSVSVDGGASVLKGDDIPDVAISTSFLPLISFGDPTVAPGIDGNFFYGSLAATLGGNVNGVMLAKSNPNLFDPNVSCVTSTSSPTTNACWTAILVAGNNNFYSRALDDKPMIAVDRSNSPFSGSVYVAWNLFIFSPYGGSTTSSSLARCDSDLNSCAMLAGGILPPLSGTDQFADFTTPVVDANGNVFVTWCNYGTPTTFGPVTCKIRSSPPGGASFGGTTTILSFMGPGTTLPSTSFTQGFASEQFRTASIPFLAVDTSSKSTSGNLYFTIQVCTSGTYIAIQSSLLGLDNPGNCGLSAILVSGSTNAGLTWSTPTMVSQPAVNAQPYITVDPVTGHVYVVYYTTQFDPFNHRIDVVASKSSNAGSTFHQNRITSVSNEPDSDPNMFFYASPFGGSWTAPQYGDYFQATAIGGTLWVLFTANYAVEQGTFQTDPYLAVITNQ